MFLRSSIVLAVLPYLLNSTTPCMADTRWRYTKKKGIDAASTPSHELPILRVRVTAYSSS